MAKKSARNPFQEALKLAQSVHKNATSWNQLYNSVFGPGGAASTLFRTAEDRAKFIESPEHAEIWKLIESLQKPETEAGGALNIRLPRSLHQALKDESEAEGVSINQLCVAKLSMQLATLVK